MKSLIFYEGIYKEVEVKAKEMLNNQTNFLSARTIDSPRAVGDALQSILEEEFQKILEPYIKDYSAAFARRSMADIAFTDNRGLYYIVDVKTHRTDTSFNMPNLTSVERLARLYEDDSNVFSVLLLSYMIEDEKVLITDVKFFPIEFLSWDCLTIGALGWGQIQIANTNKLILKEQSRKTWMLELCKELAAFYPKEILKINERIIHFDNVREKWEHRQDIWS